MGWVDSWRKGRRRMPVFKGRRPILMIAAVFLVYVHRRHDAVAGTSSLFLSASALSHRGQQKALTEAQAETRISADDEKEEEMPPPLFPEGDCAYPGDIGFEKVSIFAGERGRLAFLWSCDIPLVQFKLT